MNIVTKQLLLEKGARLIHEKGYNATGIQEVLKSAGVPKGSFYFYFESKEDFGLRLIEYFMEYFMNKFRIAIEKKENTKLQNLKIFFEDYQLLFQESECRYGCPIGNLGQEMSENNEPIRKKIEQSYQDIIGAFEEVLRSAQDDGEIPSSISAKDTAKFIFYSWEGAIMAMKVTRNIQPLEYFNKIIFEQLLK